MGLIPPNLAPCTVEKVAINAVMAGCKPEYMPVVLGVYRGRERHMLWRRVDDRLHPAGRLELAAGEYQVLEADAIHAVQALDGAPSLGLHVYLGALTDVRRHLFDWDSGAPVPMTDESFEAMKRRV